MRVLMSRLFGNARIAFHPENGQTKRFVIHQGGQQLEARRAAN